MAPRATVAFQVEVTAGSFRRASVAQLKCRRRDAASDEICLQLRRTGQIDLRSDVREPRKSDPAASELADIMVDALSSEASRKTGRPSDTKQPCVSFMFLPEAGVSPEGDHTPTDELRALLSVGRSVQVVDDALHAYVIRGGAVRQRYRTYAGSGGTSRYVASNEADAALKVLSARGIVALSRIMTPRERNHAQQTQQILGGSDCVRGTRGFGRTRATRWSDAFPHARVQAL